MSGSPGEILQRHKTREGNLANFPKLQAQPTDLGV